MKVGDMIRVKNIPKDVQSMWAVRNGCCFIVRKITRQGNPWISAKVIHDSNFKGKKVEIILKENEFELVKP